MAGDNWILIPASMFAGHYRKEFGDKFNFNGQFQSSLSPRKRKFRFRLLSFSSGSRKFASIIPVEHANEFMKEVVFEYRDVISNVDFIIDLCIQPDNYIAWCGISRTL